MKPFAGEWELIDGQQRLTTLFLIFQFMKNEGLKSTAASYNVRYETRPGSAQYLQDPAADKNTDNIDFFHIHQAYEAIRLWFAGVDEAPQYVADKLNIALYEHVHVIWYEAPTDLDATTLFTRLNMGRIPLTDAELVKALLLSKIRLKGGLTDRALETAVEWDTIERDLRDPELWAYITAQHTGVPTHISLLLDTLAGGPTGHDRPLFYTFETLREQIINDPDNFWRRVVNLHSLVLGWHANRDLVHKIGYLVAQRKTSLIELMNIAANQPKTTFEARLDTQIRQHLDMTSEKLRDLTYSDTKPVERVLLLMNVETVRQREHSTERYSFKEHASGRWSLEHIHAQNAQDLPRRTEVWEQWLRHHHKAIANLETVVSETHADLLERVEVALAHLPIKGSDFDVLSRELTSALTVTSDSSTTDNDSIANLALLNGNDNSALNNSVFAVKRNEVIDLDQLGHYIPVCTRNIFLKYYSPSDDHQMHFWSSTDRVHYLNALEAAIFNYLTKPEQDA